jgi:penicillin-binding protein 1A
MAYAYNTLANGGARVSGTQASQGNGEGPVAIDRVLDQDDEPVPDNLGASGENEKVSEQVIDSSVAETATDILHTVVTSGTGERAQVGDDYIWGKTGTTDNNADAWFVGANEEITVAVWVGYPDGATPMETEFGGLPVDGGTIPALIWNEVVSAWDALQAERGVDEESTTTTTTPETYVPPATTTPETYVPPATTAPVEPAPTETAPAPVEPAPTEPAPSGTGGAEAGGTVP